MALPKITEVSGTGVYVPGDDIDTDRIIPARFMKCVTFDGLDKYLFYDVRFDDHGEKKNHPLNDSRFAQASVMLSGANFGCGSSREHAPQSLHRAGFRALIAGNFAEIFFGNSINLGIPCVSMKEKERNLLASIIEAQPGIKIVVDVANLRVHAGNQSFSITLREGARDALLNGKWDPLEELLESNEKIQNTSATLHYV